MNLEINVFNLYLIIIIIIREEHFVIFFVYGNLDKCKEYIYIFFFFIFIYCIYFFLHRV